MPWYVYFIAGGSTFLPGAGLIALAVTCRSFFRRRWVEVLSIAMAVVGIVLVVISAEALPRWLYLLWIVLNLAWFLRDAFKNRRFRRAIDIGILAVTFFCVAIAISYRMRPSLPTAAFAQLYVIGDSISAGIGDEHGTTWPGIMQADHQVKVINLARAGSTIGDATRHLNRDSLADGLVLLEVGGNDIIGHTSADQFGANLEALAKKVCPGREVVMLELPLFPFDNAYGIQQRRVASLYKIHLIPRRYFVGVLDAPGATLDGIHLSAIGHRRMEQMIWGIVGPSLRATLQ